MAMLAQHSIFVRIDDPGFQRPRQLLTHGFQQGHAFAIGDHVVRAGDRKAMRQRGACKVRVDQGGRYAAFGQPHPGGDIFQPILHQQRDGVAASQSALLGPNCEMIGERVKLRIGQAFAFEPDRCPVREAVHGAFEIIADQNVARRLNSVDTRYDGGEAAKISPFARRSRPKARHLSPIRFSSPAT